MAQNNIYNSLDEYRRAKGKLPSPKPEAESDKSEFDSLAEYRASRVQPVEAPELIPEKVPPKDTSSGAPFLGDPSQPMQLRTGAGGLYGGVAPMWLPREQTTKKEEPFVPPKMEAWDSGGPSWMQRILGFFGADEETFDAASDRAKAQALVEVMAREKGMSVKEYTLTPDFLEQVGMAFGSFLDSFTFGILPATTEALTGVTPPQPENTSEKVIYSLAHLLGLIKGPFQLAGKALPMGKLGKWAANAPGGRVIDPTGAYELMMKQGIKDSLFLALGIGSSATGEALRETTFTESAKVLGKATLSGAVTGAIFGVVKGLFPSSGMQQWAGRIISGFIGLNAYRAVESGGNPFTERPVEDVILDTVLDVYFLSKGISPAEFRNAASDIEDLNKKTNDFLAKKDLVESIPDEVMKKVAQAKLETEQQKLDEDIEKLSKRVYKTAEAEQAGKQRQVRFEEIKAKIEKGEIATAEDVQKARRSRKKIQDVKAKEPEKTTEEVKEEIKKEAEEPMKPPTKEEVRKVAEESSKRATRAMAPVDEPDRSKIDQTKITPKEKKAVVEEPTEPEPLLDFAKISEMEKFFGKDFDELTDSEIDGYFKGTAKQNVISKEPKEITDDDIENFYGKKFEDLTDAEIDRFIGEVEVKEPEVIRRTESKKEIDYQIGEPKPEELVGEGSIFDLDVETTRGQAEAYEGNKSVARSMDELLNQELTSAKRGPDATLWDLIVKMNRWKYGDDKVDIDATREFISELASRADEFEGYFESLGAHESWAGMAEDAANWARSVERGKSKGTSTNLYVGLPMDDAAKIGGFTMYSGFDPEMLKQVKKSRDKTAEGKSEGDEIIEKAKGLPRYTDKARGVKELRPRSALSRARAAFTSAIVDKSGNMRRLVIKHFGQEGYDVLQRVVLARGHSSIAARMLGQMRGEVYGGLNRKMKRVADNLILGNRMIDVGSYKQHYRFPKEIDPLACKLYNALFPYIEGLTPEQARELIEFDANGKITGGRVKAFYDWMKKPLKDLLDHGLITEQEYNDLSSHNYRRVELVADAYDKKHPDIKVRGRSVYDSGIESISLGKQTDIYEPSSEVMALEVFNRAYGRILNNEANLALLNLARNNSDNPFARHKESKDSEVSIPSGWKKFFVYEDGERKTIHLSPEFAAEWISSSTETSYRTAQLLKYLSGAPVVRTFATGINWGFALANLPRDIAHIWFAARTYENGKWKSLYNTALPVYGGQMTADLAGVAKDAVLRRGRWIDYIMEGGGFEFLTHQGRLFQRGRHIKGGSGVDVFFDIMGYLGETSEILGRLAIRDRVIKRRAKQLGIKYEEAYKDPKIRQEATFAARDYMDFGQGGWASKTLDQAIPYLNASIQGSRGMFRAFIPGSGTFMSSVAKLSQYALLVSGIHIAKRKMHPETTEELQGNVNEENNLVIPLGDDYAFEASNGQIVYPFIKFPLDPSQKFFKTFFEAATDKWLGNEIDVDRVIDSLKQFSPVSDVTGLLPPTISAFVGYVTNKDFWLNEEIWKQGQPFGWLTTLGGEWVGSREEYLPGQTPEVYKDIGQATRLSPERTRYAVEELVTSGTEISYILGMGYDKLLGDLPKSEKQKALTEVLARVPGARRFIGITNPYSKFGKEISDIETRHELERWIRQRNFDAKVDGYLFEGNVSYAEVVKEAKQYKDIDITKNLISDFNFSRKTKNLQNRSFWLSLKRLPAEGRAEAFVNRLDKADTPEKKAELYKELATVRKAGGVIGDTFIPEVIKLRLKRSLIKK